MSTVNQEVERAELSHLQLALLSNLNEDLFFVQLSKSIKELVGESERVEIFEVLHNDAAKLVAINGEKVEEDITYPCGVGLPGYVVKTKRCYYSNSQRDPLLAGSHRPKEIVAEACIPVIVEDFILGTINLMTSDENLKYDEERIESIKELITSIAKPLKNMKIYLMARNLNQNLQDLLDKKEKELKESNSGLGIVNKNISQEPTLVGHSSEFVKMMELANKVAKEDYPIFLNGESGVGKKVIAKKVHFLSPRKENAYELLHCSSLDDSILEKELFGIKEIPGAIERCNGGTLTLDSIDSLSLNIQAKLLRFLLTGTISRAESDSIIPVNVRLVTTSKVDMKKMLEEERFREDLFYRLSLMTIDIPNLTNRKSDLKILGEFFLNQYKQDSEKKMLTTQAVEKLNNYSFPGNIQELQIMMERISLLVDEKYIDERHLPELVDEKRDESVEEKKFEQMSLHDLEKIHICNTLEHLGGNKTKAAKALGITVKTLYNKLHSYGLVNPKSE